MMLLTVVFILVFILWLISLLYLYELADRQRQCCPRPTWTGLVLWSAICLYARFIHRLKISGIEHFLARRPGEAVLLVANHTGSADIALLQAAAPFEIRWIMWNDASMPGLINLLRRFSPLIMVEQDGKDLAAMREALRELKSGGAIGIFPEGGIERPPETIIPFFEGVGLLVKRGRALVIPVWIHDTPKVNIATRALFMPSHARLDILPPMRFAQDIAPEEITHEIRAAIQQASGWPDGPVPPPQSLSAAQPQPSVAPGAGSDVSSIRAVTRGHTRRGRDPKLPPVHSTPLH